MTTTQEVRETGPMLSGGAEPGRWVAPRESGATTELDDQVAKRARKLQNQTGRSIQRVALLGVLLARLEGVPFEGTSALLSIKPPRLLRFMHGEETIPASVEARWVAVSQILDNLHAIIRPEATWRWFNTSVNDLGGRTPLDAIEKRQAAAVLEVVRSYHDPSFH